MRLLIVEDNHRMRRLIKRIVSDLAETIYESSDGVEAFQAYDAHRPDWVLMDIEMKGLDGITATRQITSAFPDARVIIVSEYDNAEWREEARRAGAREYVLKKNLSEVRRLLQSAQIKDKLC